MQVLTPYDLQILIRFYHTTIGAARPGERGSILRLCDRGLIKPRDEPLYFEITDRGRAHVRQLCAVELPVLATTTICTWHTADGKCIEEE